MSEADIQRDILKALAAIGAFAWRAQAGKVRVRGGWMRLGLPGTPDILVILPGGRLLGLEVKTATGAERAAQVAWANAARRLGAAVRTVRTVEEAVSAYLDEKRDPGASWAKQSA